ncbi:helix-turn-helix transcriptional regulator [Pseudomonas aeruginosa]
MLDLGCCAPTEGTIYPVLREFEQGGYVTAHTETVAGRGRKGLHVDRQGPRSLHGGGRCLDGGGCASPVSNGGF